MLHTLWFWNLWDLTDWLIDWWYFTTQSWLAYTYTVDTCLYISNDPHKRLGDADVYQT